MAKPEYPINPLTGQPMSPIQPAPEQPKPNLFRNWGQNGNGNWNGLMQQAPAQQWADQQMQRMGITQKPTPAPGPVTQSAQQTVAAKPQATRQAPRQAVPAVDPNSSTSGIDALTQMMGYTTPEQEEKMRRASVANQRIMAVADALRHIGNIASTNKYAPAQIFNNPVAEEQARYERGKAVRDRANQTYLTYQQQKAVQEAKQRQWEQTFNYNAARDAARLKAQQDYQRGQLAERRRATDLSNALGRARLEETHNNNEATRKQREAYQKGQLALGRERVNIARTNASNQQTYRQWRMNGGSGGTGASPLDTPKGQIIPNGKSYSNQLLQMFDYARDNGWVKESDVSKRLRELGFGKDQSDNVKRQMVMDLLRTNPQMGDYASSRLGWTYGTSNPSTNWDEYADDENENWDEYLDD